MWLAACASIPACGAPQGALLTVRAGGTASC